MLTVMSADAFENAKALTIALKRAVARDEGWSLTPGDFSLEVLMAGLGCDEEQPDDECLKKIAESVDCDRFIWGTMKLVGDQVQTELHLWERGRNIGFTQFAFSVNLTDASDAALLEIAEDAFNELIGGAEGKLIVIAGDATGQVLVNGVRSGEIADGNAELTVPSGELSVVVEAAGYLKARGTATVPPGGKTKLVLDLVPDPDYVPPTANKSDGPLAEQETPRDRGSRQPVDAQKAVGLAFVGAGVIVAGVGAGYWVSSYLQRNDEVYEDYRATVDRNEDPCERAKADQRSDIIDRCEANRSTRNMARILTPAGGVVAVAGLVLVLTDKPAQKRADRRVHPSVAVGPRGGSVELSIRF